MRVTTPAVLCLVASAFTGCLEAGNDEIELEGQIEKTIVLPAGARTLGDYSRYYAKNPDGSVSAVYIIHPAGHFAAVARACREVEDSPFPCPIADGEVRLVKAGGSTWVEEAIDLPMMNDGGCMQVTFDYHPRDDKFGRLTCNGQILPMTTVPPPR